MDFLIKEAHIFDPKNKIDEVLDLYVRKGRIAELKKGIEVPDAEVFHAKGLHLFPGLIDAHVHFREPGYEQKETIATGAQAALRGGFVAVVTMPNTNPPCDHQSVIDNIIRKAREVPFHVFPAGTITRGREGKQLSEMADLKRAGVWAVSDDGNWVQDSLVMRRAMDYASMLDLLVIQHVEDQILSANGVMNEGLMSTKLGLHGIPSASEVVAVLRDVELAKLTGARLHLQHLSTKEALDIVRKAKSEGVSVTCEVTPHHISLTDEALLDYDTNFKMNPPLRTEEDRQALVKGLSDGTVDIIASDHAPHTEEEKMEEFKDAPYGVIGLETSLGVVLTELYHKKILSLEDVVRKMSTRPAEILKLPTGFGEVRVGSVANITFVDLNQEWTVRAEDFVSKSRNSCFVGKKLKGRVTATLCSGRLWKW